ncbi:MAG: dCTP deaminase, partial [Candidatus Paceibacterota bacterium]
MILTRGKIKEEMQKGGIVINPVPADDQIGPGSVDLHLGNIFRKFRSSKETVFDVTDDVDAASLTEEVMVNDGDSILIMPDETVLGVTRERVTLAPYLAAWIE